MRRITLVLGVALLVAGPAAAASFHLMQIEQVIGGVCGDPAAQAIQLRMRFGGQNFINGTKLVAYDAEGLNPVEVIVFPANVPNGDAGSRILASTAALTAAGGPPPDFTLTQVIPESYLEAGRLTFQAGATIYWSLAWGGAAYTGPTTGSNTFNDADGDFGPPYDDVLAISGSRAVLFQGPASALSTTNQADYAPSAAEATFTNNAGASGTLDFCLAIFGDGFESGDTGAWSSTT